MGLQRVSFILDHRFVPIRACLNLTSAKAEAKQGQGNTLHQGGQAHG